MTEYLAAVIALQSVTALCLVRCLRTSLLESVVAMEMASAMTVLSVVLLARAMGRPAWYDLAIALALLGFPSGMVFLVFMEKWL